MSEELNDPTRVIQIQQAEPLPVYDGAAVVTLLKSFCEAQGLVWNEGNWQFAEKEIVAAGLTTEQAVAVGRAHIVLVNHLFNPAAYSFKGRVLLALHFLLNRKLK